MECPTTGQQRFDVGGIRSGEGVRCETVRSGRRTKELGNEIHAIVREQIAANLVVLRIAIIEGDNENAGAEMSLNTVVQDLVAGARTDGDTASEKAHRNLWGVGLIVVGDQIADYPGV